MRILLAIFLFASLTLKAQHDQKEIDAQVWIPFTKAIMNQDVPAFIAVHSKDVIRAERNSKQILNYAEYERRMIEGWPRWKTSIQRDQLRYTFELRFLERISNGTQAFETGFFKNETTKPTGEKEVGYGKFAVALRKENGVWKILVDSDSNEGGAITEKDFLAAQPITP